MVCGTLTLSSVTVAAMTRTPILLSALLVVACQQDSAPQRQATATAPAVAEQVYATRRASRDGIGKIYLGREISHVMGHLGAGWLERPEREREERTDLLIDNLPIDADDTVVDIGAGTGYFSFPMAAKVPQGQVIAVDIQPQMLDIIEQRKQQLGIANVEARLGTETDPNLASASVDLILIVDAYHEFSYPQEMGLAMAEALRPGGKLILIEYRAEDPTVPIKRLHKMSEAQARMEMAAIGLRWVETGAFLPQQHFLVFQRPDLSSQPEH